jgi:hypothetical protein
MLPFWEPVLAHIPCSGTRDGFLEPLHYLLDVENGTFAMMSLADDRPIHEQSTDCWNHAVLKKCSVCLALSQPSAVPSSCLTGRPNVGFRHPDIGIGQPDHP